MQVKEAQRVPNNMNLKRPTPRHTIYKCQGFKTKRILKAVRENQLVTYKGVFIKLSDNFSRNRNFAGQKELARNIQ